MHNIIYLLLRRMRAPLIVVILAYAISILGLVLIPGMDDQGNPWRMDFFHAFYFVSFTGSTIGFGEIPYPFTDAQRLWTTIAMYTTVLAWLYAIGSLFALIQDRAFRNLVDYSGFTRGVRSIKEPFYLVCGLGDAGRLVVYELAARGIRSVVIEKTENKLHALQLEDLGVYVPGLCADASRAASLTAAGLKNPYCAATIAVTDSDHINLAIAITSKLLAPDLKVICRAETHDAQANMASFGTDSIVNPYDTFADRFAMMFQTPSMYLVYEWLTGIRDAPLKEFVEPPKGKWVLCGFGRFGKAVQKSMSFEGIRSVVIESNLSSTQAPEGTIEGRGTEAITLYEADIDNAVGIIAGTDDDSNNLSIIITALAINKDLFTVARQNRSRNDAVFNAADIDLVIQPGTITGRRIVNQITNPLLTDFLRLARTQSDEWANILVSRVVGILSDRPPESWILVVGHSQTPAIIEAISKGYAISLGMLCTDPRDLTECLPCVPLLLKRQHDDILVPANDTFLQPGDQLLFCGGKGAETHMRWSANDFNALIYISDGVDRPSGLLWRWLSERGVRS